MKTRSGLLFQSTSTKMDGMSIDGGSDESLARVLRTLLFFTILMVTMPISLYFITKSWVFESMFGMTSTNSYFYAAIVAIFAVHVVLAMFIYAAWTEGAKPQKRE